MSSVAASRRRFVQGLAVLGGAGALGFMPRSACAEGVAELRGSVFDLSIAETPVNITGKPRMATTVNGTAPAGAALTRRGHGDAERRQSPEGTTSIHWHGVRSPANMDGVPGLSFRGIMPGKTFTYRIPIKQAGTYWYHSHSGM